MPPPRRENTIAQIANAAGGLGSAIWDFLTLIITLLPKMGARVANILAIVVMVFVALYIFMMMILLLFLQKQNLVLSWVW